MIRARRRTQTRPGAGLGQMIVCDQSLSPTGDHMYASIGPQFEAWRSLGLDVMSDQRTALQTMQQIVGNPENEPPSNLGTFEEASKPGSSINIKKRRTDIGLQCRHAGCTHEGTFRGHYELKRHIRVKHDGEKLFSCPFPGCYKGTSAPSFARPDKLTSHIRTAHGRQTEKSIPCPATCCQVPAMPLDLLGTHIGHKHRSFDWIADDLLRCYAHAASSAYRQCPLWRCGKVLALSSLVQHLMKHSVEELEEVAEILRAESYVLVKDALPHNVTCDGIQIATMTCSCHVLRVEIACPVCSSTFRDHAALEVHIDGAHLVAKDQQEHFVLWQRYARGSDVWSTKQKFPPFNSWTPRKYWHDVRCPACEYSEKRDPGVVDHQTVMLADPKDIKPYRRGILRLYPDFATHPVWNDLS